MRKPSKTRPDLPALLELDRIEMAAKVRGARAVLGWSQTELGKRTGLAQRSIHKLEQGSVDMRRSTALALEKVFGQARVQFEDIPSGGFKIVVNCKRSRQGRSTPK